MKDLLATRKAQLQEEEEAAEAKLAAERDVRMCGGGMGEGGVTHAIHGRGRTTVDPRISSMPGRSTLGFHRPGRQMWQKGGQKGGGGTFSSCMAVVV